MLFTDLDDLSEPGEVAVALQGVVGEVEGLEAAPLDEVAVHRPPAEVGEVEVGQLGQRGQGPGGRPQQPAAGQCERGQVRVGGQGEAADLGKLRALAQVEDAELPETSEGVIRKAREEVLAESELLESANTWQKIIWTKKRHMRRQKI